MCVRSFNTVILHYCLNKIGKKERYISEIQEMAYLLFHQKFIVKISNSNIQDALNTSSIFAYFHIFVVLLNEKNKIKTFSATL